MAESPSTPESGHLETWVGHTDYRTSCLTCPDASDAGSYCGCREWAARHAARNPGHLVGVEQVRTTFYEASTPPGPTTGLPSQD